MEAESYSVYCEDTANDKKVITMENNNKGSHNYGKWQ